MTAKLPYFHERDGVWQYERRVPLRVRNDARLFQQAFRGQALFRRSLRTKCPRAALTPYQAAHREFERLLAMQGNVPVPSVVVPQEPKRIVTDCDLTAISDRYAELTAGPFERLHARANVCSIAADELQRMESDLEMDGEAISAALRSRIDDPSIIHPVSEAMAIIVEHQFFAPEGSETRGAIISAVRGGIERGYRRVSELSDGRALPKLDYSFAAPKSPNRLTLADAVDRYFRARKLPVKAVNETRLALRQFERVVGRKTLDAVSRDDVHRFVEYLAAQKVGGKTAGSIVRFLSQQSIQKRLRLLSAAIRHARDRGLSNADNFLTGVRVSDYVTIDKAVMPDKRRFQISELNAIFKHPWFTGCASATNTHQPGPHRLTGSHFWVPIVALFTGCRAAELGGLKLSEVRIDDVYPHLIIRSNEYRRTKNNRARCVPIIDTLMQLGFPEFVDNMKQRGYDRLFGDWTACKIKGGGDTDFPAWSNSGIIRSFNRIVIPATLGDKLSADARREVSFHSFRGAFKAMLGAGNNVAPLIYDEVVAHAHSELNQRYIGEVTIEETYPAVRSASFKGLVLPNPPISAM